MFFVRVNERMIPWTINELSVNFDYKVKFSFLCTYWPAQVQLMPSFICSLSTTWLTLSVRGRTCMGRGFNSVKKTVYWCAELDMRMSFCDFYCRCQHYAFKSVWRDDFPKLKNQRHAQVPPQTYEVKDWFLNSFITKIASFSVRRSLVFIS